MASSSNMIAVSFFLVIAFFGAAMAKDLHVNWGTYADVDYDAWVANTTIVQGDRLFFDYPEDDAENIDVRQVSEEKFNSCEHDPADRGNDVGHRGIELSDSGTYYFINDFPGMCESGWKLQFDVLTKEEAAATPPPPPPPPPSGPATPTRPFFPVTPETPFFPLTPPPSPGVMLPCRSGGAPSTLVSLSTLTFPLCFFISSLFMH